MPNLTKNDLQKLIGKGDTADVLEALLNLLPQGHKSYHKFILLQGQWETTKDHLNLNLESRASVAIEMNRISHATLEYLNDLSEDSFNPPPRAETNEPKIRDLVVQIAENNAEEYDYDLFISFSSKDLEETRTVCDALRGYGLRVFFSDDDMRLKGGQQFSEVIDHALENSRHFLLHCTPNSMDSQWVRKEYATFHDQIHMSEPQKRRFLIFEGKNFSAQLLRITYRNIQRLRNINEILAALLPDSTKYDKVSPHSQSKNNTIDLDGPIKQLVWDTARTSVIEADTLSEKMDILETYLTDEANSRFAEDAKKILQQLKSFEASRQKNAKKQQEKLPEVNQSISSRLTKPLPALRKELNELLIEDLLSSIKALKDLLPESSEKLREVLGIQARLTDANKGILRGIMSNEEYQRYIDIIRADYLDLILSLEEADFEDGDPSTGPKNFKKGSLLYFFPPDMPVGEETKCFIRIAVDDMTMFRDIELNENVILKPLVRNTGVIGVEVFDPVGERDFDIRTLNESVQFIDHDDYSEWVFYVKKLREGTHSLVIRVSIIEIVDGVERKRDLVLEVNV